VTTKPNKKQQQELRINRKGQRPQIRTNAATGQRTISGRFLTYGVLSNDLGGFKEIIRRGAVKSLNNPDIDFVADYNHDSNMILARESNNSLAVSDDGQGLRYKMTLPTGVSYVDDLINLMEQGLITDCSFAFTVNEDGESWAMEGNQLVRTLTSITVYSGSIVGQPAYPQTVADLRNCPVAFRSKLKRSSDDMDDDNPCNPNGSSYDPDSCDDLDVNMGSDSEDGDDNDSEDYRCNYRCAACRNASHVHMTNLSEDDPLARSKKKIVRALSADDIQEQQRCQYRCAACRSLLSSHWPVPNAVNDDDPTARAYKHLLSLRR
jgi:uncharacterized protein